MLNDFREIMKEIYEIDNIELNSNFKVDFGLSSFDFVNLMCLIEEKYNVELDEKRYRSINTVKEMIAYIEELKNN